MKFERLAALTVSAVAKGAEIPVLKDGKLSGFEGCLSRESAEPHYYDLVNAKSDEG